MTKNALDGRLQNALKQNSAIVTSLENLPTASGFSTSYLESLGLRKTDLKYLESRGLAKKGLIKVQINTFSGISKTEIRWILIGDST